MTQGRLRPFVLHWVRIIWRILPETRCFAIKRAMLRLAGAEVAPGVRLCSSVTILGAGRLRIGADTWVGHQVLLCVNGSVVIGSKVDLAPRVFIGDGTHVIDVKGVRAAGPGVVREVRIGDGAWLGAGVTVLPGVTIGGKAVIAAAAVVIQSIPGNCVAAGVPAVIVRNSLAERPL